MRVWDRDHPGVCDLESFDQVLYHLVGRVLPDLAEGAERADRAISTAADGWSGRSADAWEDTARPRVTAIRDFHDAAHVGAETLNLYLYTVASIKGRSTPALAEWQQTTLDLSRAEDELDRVRADPSSTDDDRWQALARVQRCEDDQRSARSCLDRLDDEREQADYGLRAGLERSMPPSWVAGGGTLTGTLPPTALARGTHDIAAWARGLPDGPQGDAALRWLATQLSDQDLDALLAACPALATRLMSDSNRQVFGAEYPTLATALGVVDADARIAAVMSACASMSPDQLADLARAWPGVVHNLDGMSLPVRIAANRTAVRAAILDVEEQIAGVRRQTAAIIGNDPLQVAMRRELEGSIADLQARQGWYGQLLAESSDYWVVGERDARHTAGHQVVLFEPDAGRFGEVVGDVQATSIGILVGGTGTNLKNMPDQRDRASEFVKEAGGGLAVIAYLGGPMPQNIATIAPDPPHGGYAEAADSAYARAIAPHLAAFANGVRATTGATVTAVGHSYGGSVVGAAEAAGMVVDRVLHVESAGSGPGVSTPQDYAAPDTPRYVMTAPNDPIIYAQGMSVGPLGHGTDPNVLPGITRLETGRVDSTDPHSPLVQGGPAHSGVFGTEGSDTKPDAWQNIYSVLIGGDVTTWTPPQEVWDRGPGGELRNHVEYPMADATFVPPTVDVP